MGRSGGFVERGGVVARASGRGLGAQRLRRRRIARLGPLVSAAARGGGERQNRHAGGDENLAGNAHMCLPVSAEAGGRSEEHTSELQSLMRISYAVFCLKKKTITKYNVLSTKSYM